MSLAPHMHRITAQGLLRRSFDGVALVVLFLHVTELYRPLGYLARLPSSQVLHIVLLAFYSFFLVANARRISKVFRSRVPLVWTLALFIAPTLTLIVQAFAGTTSLDRVYYWTTQWLLVLEFLMVAVLIWERWGDRITAPFFLWCIGAAWFGFVINVLNYPFVRELMRFSSNRIAASELTTRLLGFFQHPNVAGLSICLFLAVLVTDRRFLSKGVFFQSIAAAACIGGVLVTGSRTSLLLLAIVLLWYLRNALKGNERPALKAARVMSIPAMMLGMGAVAFYAIAGARTELVATALDRAGSVLGLFGGDIGSSDESASLRLAIVNLYLRDIGTAPIEGRGVDYARDRILGNDYTNVSQNSWLEWALGYGIVYSIVVAVAIIATLLLTRRLRSTRPFVASFGALFVLLCVIATFSVVDLFWLRAVTCVLGVLIGTSLHQSRQANPGGIG